MRHEAFQREKQGARYREAWIRVNADLPERKEDLKLILFLEYLIEKATRQVEGLADAEVSDALSQLRSRLGPIELVTPAPSPLARLLWEDLAPRLQTGELSRQRVKDGFARVEKLVEALRDPETPRAFLQGLASHVEEFLPEAPKQEPRGLILTPDDLRRFP